MIVNKWNHKAASTAVATLVQAVKGWLRQPIHVVYNSHTSNMCLQIRPWGQASREFSQLSTREMESLSKAANRLLHFGNGQRKQANSVTS